MIQVALGDYHYAALTSSGELYTWGMGSRGQLGLGSTARRGQNEVEEPEKVVFPDDATEAGKKGCFVFGIAAAGWHTGALVLGDPKKVSELRSVKKEAPVEASKDEDEMPGSFPRQDQIGNHVPLGSFQSIFRVGFAGRGLRGRGMGSRPSPL